MTKKEKVKKIAKKADKKEPKVKKKGYFHNLKLELSKVKWPNADEVVKYSVATLVFCLFLGFFFQGLDLFMTFIKGLFS